jgi:uncharacterized membrane protein
MHHTQAINKNSTAFTAENTTTYTNPWRINAMDIQRGVIMILMAFSHCRDYVGVERYSNLDFATSPAWLGSSLLDIFHQIFVSTLVAGGFFMMMGISIVFLYQARLKEGWSLEKTCVYLIQRGCVLVLLQFTILQLFEFIAEQKIYLYVGVLFGLGIDMILASLCIYTIYKLKSLFAIKNSSIEYILPLTLILVITLSIQVFMTGLHNSYKELNFWIIALITGGDSFHNGFRLDFNFTPIPWFPAVAFGLMIGQLLFSYKEKSFKLILGIALSCLISWLIIRAANLYGIFHFGDYKFLASGDVVSPAAFFGMSKYPPSITYFLWAFAINLLGICLWQFAEKHFTSFIKLMNPIKIIGQCALFFFVVHWFVYYGISLFVTSHVATAPSIISLWLLGLIPLYLMCKRYNAFKLQQPQTSKWRMF